MLNLNVKRIILMLYILMLDSKYLANMQILHYDGTFKYKIQPLTGFQH